MNILHASRVGKRMEANDLSQMISIALKHEPIQRSLLSRARPLVSAERVSAAIHTYVEDLCMYDTHIYMYLYVCNRALTLLWSLTSSISIVLQCVFSELLSACSFVGSFVPYVLTNFSSLMSQSCFSLHLAVPNRYDVSTYKRNWHVVRSS